MLLIYFIMLLMFDRFRFVFAVARASFPVCPVVAQTRSAITLLLCTIIITILYVGNNIVYDGVVVRFTTWQ